MKRDIEKQFLKAYQSGGVVHFCIDVIRQRYDLGYFPNKKPLSEEWQKYYNETLPDIIKSETAAFDDTVITTPESPLIDEISDNLSECKTMQDKERYIHSLIVPFRELSELLHPEKTPKQRVQTLVHYTVQERNAQYKRLEMISERYRQLLNEPTDEVEKSLSVFRRVMYMFANRLDALLLQNSIDLLRLQNECGTYLKTHRTITDVDYYIGSLELAQKYISELPSTEKEPAAVPQQIIIPDNILQELQKTTNRIGTNTVKQMIENANAKPLKWLVTKQDLRELLTHNKIKGDFSIVDIERQTPDLFIDKNGNKIKLAKNKANNSFETDFIKQILATL